LKTPKAQTPIIFQVATKDVLQRSGIGIIFPKRFRLLNQQHSPRRILVGVFAPADLLDEIVAECHATENAACTGWRKPFTFEALGNFLGEPQMLWVSLTVNE